MKYWKCPECLRERETKDDIVMVVCACCILAMKPEPYKFESEVTIIE